jgi:rhodanese-related sulfurtransferase
MTEQTTASGLDFEALRRMPSGSPSRRAGFPRLNYREAGMNAKRNEMDLIGTRELKEKLERGDDFKLVIVLGEWEYRAKHIPGSLRISTLKEGLEALDPQDEIVLYDSGPHCSASRMAYKILKAHGYERVRRYVGGLEEWENAGYALEGEQVSAGGQTPPLDVQVLSSAM